MPHSALKTYGERLLWAMNRLHLSQSELARKIGVKPQSIQHLVDPKKHAQGSSHTATLASVLDVSSEWLSTGTGSWQRGKGPNDSVQQVLDKLRVSKIADFIDIDQGTSAASLLLKMAHALSEAKNTESLPKIRWEELMTADLTRPFELEVIDDALAPDIFRGCIALMNPARAPEPGWPVLVRDRENHHYLRDYKVGAGSRWSAVPRAAQRDMFDALESEAHGLTIIAAMDGYKRPRPAVAEGSS